MALDALSAQDQQCPRWTAQLASALRNRGQLVRPPNATQWNREFGLLRQEVSPALIQRVLDWYCQVSATECSIQAFSAASFREKFDKLRIAMQRAGNGAQILVTPAARRIVDATVELGWHSQRLIQALPAIAQISLDHYTDFQSRLHGHAATLRPLSEEANFLRHLTEGRLWYGFIESDWMPAMHRRHGWKTDFMTDPLALAFDPASSAFRELFWSVWTVHYVNCTSAGRYDSLLRAILVAKHADYPAPDRGRVFLHEQDTQERPPDSAGDDKTSPG